jgi:hypothetical protein
MDRVSCRGLRSFGPIQARCAGRSDRCASARHPRALPWPRFRVGHLRRAHRSPRRRGASTRLGPALPAGTPSTRRVDVWCSSMTAWSACGCARAPRVDVHPLTLAFRWCVILHRLAACFTSKTRALSMPLRMSARSERTWRALAPDQRARRASLYLRNLRPLTNRGRACRLHRAAPHDRGGAAPHRPSHDRLGPRAAAPMAPRRARRARPSPTALAGTLGTV